MKNLCPFEIQVLKVCAGIPSPGLEWGAAMGQALEFLNGSGLVHRSHQGVYSATEAGKELLASQTLENMLPSPTST
jgi:hypothetical protein